VCVCGGGGVGRRLGMKRCQMALCPSVITLTWAVLYPTELRLQACGGSASSWSKPHLSAERLTAGADVPLHSESVSGEARGAGSALPLPPVARAVGVHGAWCCIGHVVDVKTDIPTGAVDCRAKAQTEGRGRRLMGVRRLGRQDA